MKNKTLLILLFAFSLLLASCAPAPAPDAQPPTQPPAAAAPTEAPPPTAAPAPTATAAPTAAPEPVACTIAFESDRDGNLEIYRMAPDGSKLTNLTNNPADDFDAAWSPDGKQIAFASNRENDAEGGLFIYVMDADGGNLRQLSTENESKWPDWSHDGAWITYTHQGDIYIIKADGSEPSVNLTNSSENDEQSTWSPDGSKLAWLSDKDGVWSLFIMDASGGNVRQLTGSGKVYDAVWTIDGQLFTHWENPDGICFNCVMNADGSNVQDAGGKGSIQRYLPFWTLDGDRVECIGGENILTPDSEIYLVSEIYPDIFLNLTNNPAADRNPDWPAQCGPGSQVVAAEQEQPAVPSVDPASIVIGYAGDDQWQQDRKNNFQKACTELGIQCIYGEIPELIAQGADAIVQNSNNIAANGLFPAVQQAREKGIPVLILDAETNIDGAYSITIDHQLWAETSLMWMFKKMGGQGQFGYFDLAPFNRYSDLINELLKQFPDITVIDKRDGKYDASKIKPEFSDFVKQYPELKALWTSYDNTQAMWGMEENNIPYEKWPVIVCEPTLDGLLVWQKAQEAYPDFDCIAVGNPAGIAYDAVYAAYYLVSGEKINETALAGPYGKSLYVDIPVVTRDNLQEWLETMKKADLYSVDQWMTPEDIRSKWFMEE